MTSREIRQSFLDFFKSKQHTLVPSSSLMPDSPNLLFTNAGMNQFVPIFLGERKADVDKWAGVVPGLPTRAADTQKCIRAGGKHNDLDDVGLDTYHHTFFEMLGNWSFGDYFKKESLEWGWELITKVWKFPPARLYATVYSPDKSKGDPSDFDQEAHDIWARLFRDSGLDPAMHIVNGGKKDNFWMMGETGPCGPCSEIHVDLTPAGDTRGALVNKGDARCIEIWNHVFIQFNANPDGSFTPLPARHVDTGMGFERVTSIIQCTKGFTDFANARISNYETDIFRPIFDELEKMSGKRYGSTLPQGRAAPSEMGSATVPVAPVDVPPTGPARTTSSSAPSTPHVPEPAARDAQQGDRDGRAPQTSVPHADQIQIDIAFRVIGDHIRTLSFAIADGIQPGNTDRNYVLRRILRRAVRYGRTLGFHEPFFHKLVDVLAATMGDVFPEIRTRKQHVKDVLKLEEESFNKTLDRGIELFNEHSRVTDHIRSIFTTSFPNDGNRGFRPSEVAAFRREVKQFDTQAIALLQSLAPRSANDVEVLKSQLGRLEQALVNVAENPVMKENALKALSIFPANVAFELYDTYGFPLDLTELMARERGLTVDVAGFNALMEEQKARARAAQKKTVIELSQIETKTPTRFLGYDALETPARVLEVVGLKDKTAVVLDASTCYAEMGGQLGDTGELTGSGQLWRVTNTQKSGNTWLHFIEEGSATVPVAPVGVPPTSSSREGAMSSSTPPVSHAPESAARDAQQGDRDGRAPRAADDALPIVGSHVILTVDRSRRDAIQRHHTVTHLLHWALHEVVSREASQKGSFVGPDKLTFDFNNAPLTPQQVADVERLVNERIVENAGVLWTEVPHADVKHRKDVLQFFGDKYGDTVRVVQIGGHAAKLDGYSMELCGGTHTRATGEIGLFRIVSENAIAAGVRRIEAVAGLTAFDAMRLDRELIKAVAGKVSSPIHELEKKIEAVLAHQKELEKALRTSIARNAAQTAAWLLTRVQEINGVPVITQGFPDGDADYLQAVVDALKSHFKGVVVVGGAGGGSVTLVASVSSEFTSKVQAGKIIQAIAPIVGGKGGGKPDNARGGGKDATKLAEALAKVRSLLD